MTVKTTGMQNFLLFFLLRRVRIDVTSTAAYYERVTDFNINEQFLKYAQKKKYFGSRSIQGL